MLIIRFSFRPPGWRPSFRSELSFSNARNLSGGSQAGRLQGLRLIVERSQAAELAVLALDDVEDRPVPLNAARLTLADPMTPHDSRILPLGDHLLEGRCQRLPAAA